MCDIKEHTYVSQTYSLNVISRYIVIQQIKSWSFHIFQNLNYDNTPEPPKRIHPKIILRDKNLDTLTHRKLFSALFKKEKSCFVIAAECQDCIYYSKIQLGQKLVFLNVMVVDTLHNFGERSWPLHFTLCNEASLLMVSLSHCTDDINEVMCRWCSIWGFSENHLFSTLIS